MKNYSVVITVLFVIGTLVGVSNCVAAQTWVQNPNNYHWYALTSKLNWDQAQAKAEEWGGYLATINDADENTWVRDNLVVPTGESCFIGANDKATEGEWVWVEDGSNFWNGASTGSVVAGMYANWGGGEPNDSGGEDICEMRTDGMWNDNQVDETRYGVVEDDEAISYVVGDTSANVEVGTNYTLSVAVTRGNEPITYQWRKDGADIAGATTPSYELVNLTEADTGGYTCVITDAITSVTTRSIFIRVWPAPLPVSGALGLGLLAGAFALAGATVIRSKKR